MAKAVSPYKGKIVHIRKTWGDDMGQVDESHLYQVKACGSKMATLVRIDPNTLQPAGWRGRGQNFYLTPRAEAEQRMSQEQQRGWRSFYYWDWSQLFVPIGEAGWDPEMNY